MITGSTGIIAAVSQTITLHLHTHIHTYTLHIYIHTTHTHTHYTHTYTLHIYAQCILTLSNIHILSNTQFGKGLLKVMKVDIQSIADIIPVDMVDNLIISAAWITAVDKWVWLDAYSS